VSQIDERPVAVTAALAPPRTKASNYPAPFSSRMAGRVKRPLGDLFGLQAFGVNLTTLLPGAVSALHHRHSRQDEFIHAIEGELTLFVGEEATVLRAGDCAGFAAGGAAHHIENRGAAPATYLEVGDRRDDDRVEYPSDDLAAVMGEDGRWRFTHKDGAPY
jgi:uncharacterized cupin superfamily protein